MSVDYRIECTILQQLTDELLRNMVLTMHAQKVEFIFITSENKQLIRYHCNVDQAIEKFIKYQKLRCFWPAIEIDDEGEVHHRILEISLFVSRRGSSWFELNFRPNYKYKYTDVDDHLYVDFNWYVHRLLELTNNLPMASCIAETAIGECFPFNNWEVYVLPNYSIWFNEYEIKNNLFAEEVYQRLNKLYENATKNGYLLEPIDLEQVKNSVHLIIPGKAPWGNFILKIKEYEIRVCPENIEEKPANIRPYVEVLMALCGEKFFFSNLYANSTALNNELEVYRLKR